MKYGFCRRVCINLDLIGRRFAKQIHRDEAKRNRDEFFGVDYRKTNLICMKFLRYILIKYELFKTSNEMSFFCKK